MYFSDAVVNTWWKAQQDILNSWQRAFTLQGEGSNSAQHTNQLFNPLQVWSDYWTKLGGSSTPGQEVQQAYFQSIQSINRSYTEMMTAYWQAIQPALLQFSSQPFNEEVKRMVDPYEVSRQVEGILNLNPEEFFKRVTGNAYTLTNSLINNWGKVRESYWEMFGEARISPGMLLSSPLAMQSLLLPALNALWPVAASLNMPGMQPVNLNRQAESLLDVQEKTLAFSNKLAEMLTMVLQTAQKAYKHLSDKKQDSPGSEQNQDSRKAYNEWSKVNEIMFTALFADPAFTRLQDELSHLGLELRTAYQKAFEWLLEPFPFVLRSQPEAYGSKEQTDTTQMKALEEKVLNLQEKIMQLAVKLQEDLSGSRSGNKQRDLSSSKQ